MRKMKKILLAVISLLPVLTYGQSMKIDPKQLMPGADGNVIITRNGVNTLDNINWADINNIPTDLEHTSNKIDGLGSNLDATHYVSGKAIDEWGFIWRGSFTSIDIDATYKSGWYRLQPGGTISGTLPADYNTANVSTLTVYSPGAGAATTIHEYQTLTQSDGKSWWRHANVSGNWSSWEQYADKDWVLSQIPGAQTLSISGDNLSISNGNTVTVPNLGNSDINLPTARNIKTTNGQLNIQNSSGKGLIVGPGATILTEGGGNGVVLSTTGVTGTKIATFPNKTGTIAMTSDIPAQVNITGSGGTTVSGTYPNINISSATAPTVNDATLTMATGTGLTGSQTFTANSATNKTFTVGLNPATATTIGGVELASNTVQSVAANSVSATSGRTYGVQLNSAGQAVVNVPWTDNNTTYSAGTGLSLSGTTFNNTAPDQTVTLTNGTGINVTGTYPNFTITNTAPNQNYTLPTASASVLGGIKVGSRLSIASGVLSADNMMQTLGISGQTLSISGGNSVTLPTFTETDPIYTADKPNIFTKGAQLSTNTNFNDASLFGSYYVIGGQTGTNPPNWSVTSGQAGIMAAFTIGTNNRYLYFAAPQNESYGRIQVKYGADYNSSSSQWHSLAFLDDIPTPTIPTLDQVATAGNYSSGSISIGAPMSSYWQGASNGGHRWLQLGQGAGILTWSPGAYLLFCSNLFYYNNGSTNYKVASSATSPPSYCQFADGGFRLRTHAPAAVGTILPDNSFTQVFGLYKDEIQFNALIGTGQRMMVANADGTVTTSALPSSLTLEDVLTNGNTDGGVGMHLTGASGAQTDVGYFGNPDFKISSSNTGIQISGNGDLGLTSTAQGGHITLTSSKIDLLGNVRKRYLYVSSNHTITDDEPYNIYYCTNGVTITLPTANSSNDRRIINIISRGTNTTVSPGYYPWGSTTLSTDAKYITIQCANINGTWGWYQIGGQN